MAALAVHSFLGQVARPHYEAVARLLATRTRRSLEPVRETPLADPPLRELRTLVRLGRLPSPPVVLVGGDAALAESLRSALTGLDRDDEGRAALELGAIRRFDAVADADYAPVRAVDATR